jgi:PAS domain S-box-containing protein
MFKFRDQLLITLVLVGLIPALIISWLTYQSNSYQVKESAIKIAEQQLDSIAGGLSQEFVQAQHYANLYARTSVLKSMNYEEFIPFLNSELEFLTPHYEKFIIGKPNGHFYNTSGANMLQGGIRTFDDNSATSNPKNIRSRDYWQQTINTDAQTVYTSSPMISFTTGVKQIVTAASIMDDAQNVVGMVGLSMQWEQLKHLIDALIVNEFENEAENAHVLLVSNDGTYWHHWDEEKIIALAKDDQGKLLLNDQGENQITAFKITDDTNPKLKKLGEQMIAGKSGYLNIDYDGINQHVLYKGINKTGYSVALFVADEIVMAPVYKTLKRFLWTLFISISAIFFFGLYVSRYFSKPIDALVDKVIIAAKSHSVLFEMASPIKEIKTLSIALQTMHNTIYEQTKKIKISEERFSLAMQGANDGLWDWDLKHNTLYLSPRWKEIIGYDEDEVSDKTEDFLSYVYGDDKEVLKRLFDDYITGKLSNAQCRFRMLHKNGSIVHVLSRSKSVIKDNEVVRLVGTNTDISDLVAQENEIIQLNLNLENKVSLRTKELNSAVIAAEMANSAKSRFLSNMSHEIRTPMNGIIGLTDRCLTTELNEQQQNYLNKIKVSSSLLMTILNEILDFSKIESNMLELDLQPTDLLELLNRAHGLMLNNAEQKGIKLQLKADNIPTFVQADSVRLGQILLNLIGNAIKFTERGEVTFAVSQVSEENNDGVIELNFSVTDTGIGVKNVTEIFSAFKQEDASISRKYGGTGLGLAISQRLTALMGGELAVKSELGVGSCFSFTLSVMHAENIQLNEEAVVEPVEVKSASILIVEDNEINQMIAQEVLEELGFTVTMSNHGQHALDILEDKMFDLILMDIQMPVMDGCTATKKIRENPDMSGIPIIAMTANVMTHEVEGYLNEGFNDVIGKPFEVSDMLEKINLALSHN